MTDADDMVAAAARDALDRGLLTEADIDRAVGNSLSGRFRLGEFDGDSCPYNTEPAETDTLLHRAVNRVAAMEQMCLLHNNGILPLHLRPGAKVAVIGPLGSELPGLVHRHLFLCDLRCRRTPPTAGRGKCAVR